MNKTSEPVDKLAHELDEAERKAIQALGRYKFQMFGYWAAIWVHLNRIAGGKRPNPFLRSAGMIDYPQPGMVTITDAGRTVAEPEGVPASSDEMLSRAKSVLNGSEARLLEILHTRRDDMPKPALAEESGFSANSGGFNNYLGHMRTLGFIDYPAPGQVKCADWLYL